MTPALPTQIPSQRAPRARACPIGVLPVLALLVGGSCGCRELVEPTEPKPPAGPPVRGVVLSPAGAPVASATVLVENIKFSGVPHVNWTATTDANGAFETPLPGPGYFDVFVTYPFVDFERWAFPGVWFDAVPDTLRPQPLYQPGRVDFGFDSTVQVTHGRGEFAYEFHRPGALPGVATLAFPIRADGSFTAAIPAPGEYHALFTAFHGGVETSVEPPGQFRLDGSDTTLVLTWTRELELQLTLGGQPVAPFDGEFRLFARAGSFTISTSRMAGHLDLVDGKLRVWSYWGEGTAVVIPTTPQSFIAQALFPRLSSVPVVLELGAYQLQVVVLSSAGDAVIGALVELWRFEEAPLRWRESADAAGRAAIRLNAGSYVVRASTTTATVADTLWNLAGDTELILRLPSSLPR